MYATESANATDTETGKHVTRDLSHMFLQTFFDHRCCQDIHLAPCHLPRMPASPGYRQTHASAGRSRRI